MSTTKIHYPHPWRSIRVAAIVLTFSLLVTGVVGVSPADADRVTDRETRIETVAVLIAMANDIEINDAIHYGARPEMARRHRTFGAHVRELYRDWGLRRSSQDPIGVDELSGRMALAYLRNTHPDIAERRLRALLNDIRSRVLGPDTPELAVRDALVEQTMFGRETLVDEALDVAGYRGIVWEMLCTDFNCRALRQRFRVAPEPALNNGMSYWLGEHREVEARVGRSDELLANAIAAREEAERTGREAVRKANLIPTMTGEQRDEYIRKVRSAVLQAEDAAGRAEAAFSEVEALVETEFADVRDRRQRVRTDRPWFRWGVDNLSAETGSSGLRLRDPIDVDNLSVDQGRRAAAAAPIGDEAIFTRPQPGTDLRRRGGTPEYRPAYGDINQVIKVGLIQSLAEYQTNNQRAAAGLGDILGTIAETILLGEIEDAYQDAEERAEAVGHVNEVLADHNSNHNLDQTEFVEATCSGGCSAEDMDRAMSTYGDVQRDILNDFNKTFDDNPAAKPVTDAQRAGFAQRSTNSIAAGKIAARNANTDDRAVGDTERSEIEAALEMADTEAELEQAMQEADAARDAEDGLADNSSEGDGDEGNGDDGSGDGDGDDGPGDDGSGDGSEGGGGDDGTDDGAGQGDPGCCP